MRCRLGYEFEGIVWLRERTQRNKSIPKKYCSIFPSRDDSDVISDALSSWMKQRGGDSAVGGVDVA